MLVALVAVLAGLAIFLTRKPAATADDPGGIRVVSGTDAQGRSSSSPSVLATTDALSSAIAAPQTSPTADALPADLDPGERAALMPRLFRTEARDPAWAPGTEKTLQHAFAGIPYRAADAPMAVRCATNICEVSGEIDRSASTENVNIAMQQLQARMANDRLPAGLGDSMVMFGPLPDRPNGDGYRLYVRRR